MCSLPCVPYKQPFLQPKPWAICLRCLFKHRKISSSDLSWCLRLSRNWCLLLWLTPVLFSFSVIGCMWSFKASHVLFGTLFQPQPFSWQPPGPVPSSPDPLGPAGFWCHGVNWCMDVEGGRWCQCWHRGAPSWRAPAASNPSSAWNPPPPARVWFHLWAGTMPF